MKYFRHFCCLGDIAASLVFISPRSKSRVFIDLVRNLLFVTCFSSAEYFLVSIRRIDRFPGFVSSCCWCVENWSDLA